MMILVERQGTLARRLRGSPRIEVSRITT